jgi:hypothetical protein
MLRGFYDQKERTNVLKGNFYEIEVKVTKVKVT